MDKVKVFITIAALVLVGIAAIVTIGALDGDSSEDTVDNITHNANDMPANTETNTNGAETSPSEGTAVIIKSSAFSPNKVTIKKGTTVTWTNQDNIEHDIKPDNETSDFTGSELLGKGESYSFTFNETGNFTYHCTPHPFMKGSIEVVE